VFNAQATERILLCAHWDTRPYADQDPDPQKRTRPILGANDGASGVAVLLEVARVLRQIPPVKGVDIVLFDGEDYGRGFNGDTSDYFLGARRFAAVNKGKYAPRLGILLDMIGDKDLTIYYEGNSNRTYPDHVARVWQAAAVLGYKQFIRQGKYTISDDHIPLLEAGIPCIDLIDFDYPPWHTAGDTPDKCSPQSLKSVGDVVLKVVYEL
jgi:Zn-dependent M28 family amino/carboxypeptidase